MDIQAHSSRGITSLSPGPKGFAQGLCKAAKSNGKASGGEGRDRCEQGSSSLRPSLLSYSWTARTPPRTRSLLGEAGSGALGLGLLGTQGRGRWHPGIVGPPGGRRELSTAPLGGSRRQ